MKNYYEILEVHKNASIEIIERAYKILVKRYHPDLYTGDKKYYAEQKIKEVNEAYRVLSDDFLREQYNGEIERQQMESFTNSYDSDKRMQRQNRTNKQNENTEVKNPIVDSNKEKKVDTKYKVGSIYGIIELCKELYKNRPSKKELKQMTKKDGMAIGLTIMTILLLGVLLWFIPFTNGWMRELLFENPIFNGIGSLFSR